MHASLYNFELYKLQHAEAQRLAADERWATVVRRANRRARRSLFAKARAKASAQTPAPARALAAVKVPAQASAKVPAATKS